MFQHSYLAPQALAFSNSNSWFCWSMRPVIVLQNIIEYSSSRVTRKQQGVLVIHKRIFHRELNTMKKSWHPLSYVCSNYRYASIRIMSGQNYSILAQSIYKKQTTHSNCYWNFHNIDIFLVLFVLSFFSIKHECIRTIFSIISYPS